MRLVYKAKDEQEVKKIKNLLVSRGIATSTYDSHDLSTAMHYRTSTGIYIDFDHQYDDAISLIENPNHKTSTSVDLNKWKRYKGSKRGKSQFQGLAYSPCH